MKIKKIIGTLLSLSSSSSKCHKKHLSNFLDVVGKRTCGRPFKFKDVAFRSDPHSCCQIQKCCCDNAAQSRQVYIQERSMIHDVLSSASLRQPRKKRPSSRSTDRPTCSSSLSSSLSSSSWVLRLPPQAICLPPSFLRRSAPTARRGTSGRRAGERSPRGPSL